MKFFTSDTHFNHGGSNGERGILEYCDRPFKFVHAMNEFLIMRWNDVVPPGGLVYHLGDFAWGVGKGYGTLGVEEILDRLNGQIILIQGSHDKPALKVAHRFVKITPKLEIHEKIGDLKADITLCHYSMRTWRRSHFNSWHLYGHSHGRLAGAGKSFDCGVDTKHLESHVRYSPYTLSEIAEIMKDKPDNFNLVKERRNE